MSDALVTVSAESKHMRCGMHVSIRGVSLGHSALHHEACHVGAATAAAARPGEVALVLHAGFY